MTLAKSANARYVAKLNPALGLWVIDDTKTGRRAFAVDESDIKAALERLANPQVRKFDEDGKEL